jgi:transcription-repair coupling factor (superfamily II helicase)
MGWEMEGQEGSLLATPCALLRASGSALAQASWTLPALVALVEQTTSFATVLAALRAGQPAAVAGAWQSAAALVVAALARQAAAPVLVVLAHPADLERWAEDLESFTSSRPVLFPAWDKLPGEESLHPDDIGHQRLQVLHQLEESPPRCLVTTIQALMQPVPGRAAWSQNCRRLAVGQPLDLEELARWLVCHGFQRMEAVELPGEFSRRGGILDVYSPGAPAPYRLELCGDELESIRRFSPVSQRSEEELPAVILRGCWGRRLARPGSGSPPVGHLSDYLPPASWVILVEPAELQQQGRQYEQRVISKDDLFSLQEALARLLLRPHVQLAALPTIAEAASCTLRVESVERFSGEINRVREELEHLADSDLVLLACHNEAERQRLRELLASSPALASGRVQLVVGRVSAGFRWWLSGVRGVGPRARSRRTPWPAAITVLGDHELFRREPLRLPPVRRRPAARPLDSFLELREGDLVVHVSHGIARFCGLELVTRHGPPEEHLLLEFQNGVRVYVPASKIELVQKYVGAGQTEPELSVYGGSSWRRRKEKVREAVLDLASELIELQALRQAQPGIAYPPDSVWQAEFEAAFPYEETPDQLATLAEIKQDMERPRPMDRLICGDVGYGKTELAIRAAFKAVDYGKQVAVLVPTTVLAEQHFRTFAARLAEYPFLIESLSRFRSPAEQRQIVQRLAQGGIDIIIGTHRLLSADVQFRDLGLVIIDEEQRFGVEHKERLKRLRQTVDVLTLTATPIPRTLHQALLGIRDISNLETPPRDRLAIETHIVPFDPDLIRQAILRELNREGQVFFVHNRVASIQALASQLQEWVPEARLVVAHGQMPEHDLEQAMLRFLRRQADVLVTTTIIESGLDIPSANTILINQADTFGLADLHQLRGRVGRYKHRAYAYLLLEPGRPLSPTAARRLKAIEEFSDLGAGFQIALRDLEIRGVGNLLGAEQSGHIAAVGYELYCQLLEEAVRRLRNLPVKTPLEVTLELPWPAFLPADYVGSQQARMDLYRRLARLRQPEELTELEQELRDRFGPLPDAAQWLLRQTELRLLAAHWQVARIHLECKGLVVRPQSKDLSSLGPLDLIFTCRQTQAMQALAARSAGRLRCLDEHTAHYRLSSAENTPLALYACLKQLLRPPAETL